MSAYGVSCRAHTRFAARVLRVAIRALQPHQRPIRPIQATWNSGPAVGSPLASIHEDDSAGQNNCSNRRGYTLFMCDVRHT